MVLKSLKRAIENPGKVPRAIQWALDGTLYRKYQHWIFLRSSAFCLISFPRSGRTWIRTMVGKAVLTHYGIDSDEPPFYTTEMARQVGLPIPYISHDDSISQVVTYEKAMENKQRFRGKRILFILRDIRDSMVSYYHYQHNRKNFSGSLSDFLRSPKHGVEKSAIFHRAWYDSQPIFAEFKLIRYENLHAQTEPLLREILAFIGLGNASDETVRVALQAGSFKTMRQHETAGHEYAMHHLRVGETHRTQDTFFVRKGQTGAWQDVLSPTDLEYIDDTLTRLHAPKEWLYYNG